MNKTYQPLVIKRSEEVIEALESINFFKNENILSTKYFKTRLCNILTEKFILGELSETDPLFIEEEFNALLKEIIVHNVLEGLEKKGIVGSYEDDDVEETFFMTEKGDKLMKEIKDISID